MSDEWIDEDDEAIAKAMRGLRKERPVSEEQVDALAARLAGGESSPRRHWLPQIAAAAAVAIVAFLAGRMTHSATAAAMPPAEYVLFVHEDAVNPVDPATIHNEYSRWAGALAERGQLAGGEELSDDRLLIAAAEGDAVRRSSARATRAIGGYFILSARNESEALAIARDCPHLRHRGTVELRKIVRR